jgi:hypothetical protein
MFTPTSATRLANVSPAPRVMATNCCAAYDVSPGLPRGNRTAISERAQSLKTNFRLQVYPVPMPSKGHGAYKAVILKDGKRSKVELGVDGNFK